MKKNRQIISQNATDMMIEKSSHEETKNALDKSEQSVSMDTKRVF